MKKLFVILSVVGLLFACDSESASDCFQTSGSIIQETITVPNFNRILVNRDIELIIRQGENYEVTIETGENLINDITVEVIDDRLVLTDNNTCNFVRDFGITKMFVTTPTLSEIRCSTQFEISSDGVLNFDTLNLISEDFNEPETFPIGDFRLELDVENLNIIANNLSFFFLSGEVTEANFRFFGGDGRIEAENLIAQNINIFHRSSNDMIINPQQSLTGVINNTGDVISVNQPPVVDVDVLFTGRLIFN
ncbi:head GIN domain-containing protein [Winogradskyella immobilis]|uniref:DUF2807 domain-containing protein n=1 Tax=Winogradskyella immobilis TaxID=2816852 RepID=A0ABS8EKX5_9FLAO|nr:head GIN domain-containing protein [Winogradskyella immobilis]MCC1483869.1 DUF2807 domain-containing protein [Winogradskyella immobilis]MCG0015962.1 DUF2807 domain-containing protein [Winogradskyella immobilis]